MIVDVNRPLLNGSTGEKNKLRTNLMTNEHSKILKVLSIQFVIYKTAER